MNSLTKYILLAFITVVFPRISWGLSVTPTYQLFELKAGARTNGQLTITNDEETDITVKPTVKDFYTTPQNKKFKTRDWLKMNEDTFVIKKGESKTITFSVHAPSKAKGEVAGTLHFQTKGTNIGMISLQLSLAIYVAVKGTEKSALEIPGMAVKLSSHTDVAVMIHNTGNIHLRPRVLVEIYDSEDTLRMNAVLKYGQPALPGQPRAYEGTVKDYRLREGKYTAIIKIEDVERGKFFPDEKKRFVVNSEGKVQLK